APCASRTGTWSASSWERTAASTPTSTATSLRSATREDEDELYVPRPCQHPLRSLAPVRPRAIAPAVHLARLPLGQLVVSFLPRTSVAGHPRPPGDRRSRWWPLALQGSIQRFKLRHEGLDGGAPPSSGRAARWAGGREK